MNLRLHGSIRWILVPWLAWAVSGKAAESPPLTVASAVAEAIQNNGGRRLLLAHIETARGSARAGDAYPFNPAAVYTEGIDRHVGVSQTLEWPGKRALREALAKHDVEAAEIAVTGFTIALAAEVRTAFFELLAAREQAVFAEDDCQAARAIADVAHQRVEKGFVLPGEELKARAELVDAERQRQSAQQAIILAGLALNQWLGRPGDAPPPAVVGTLLEAPPEVPLAALLAAASARHPDLRAQALEIRKADERVSLARKERGPDIGVEVFYEQNSRDTSEQKAGFGVTVPLPVWSAGGAVVDSALAARAEAELSLEKRCGEVSAQVRRAHAVLIGAERDLALFPSELAKDLEAQGRAARDKYATGAFPFTALIDLQQTRRRYLKSHVDALLAVRRARSELEEAAGISLEELK